MTAILFDFNFFQCPRRHFYSVLIYNFLILVSKSLDGTPIRLWSFSHCKCRKNSDSKALGGTWSSFRFRNTSFFNIQGPRRPFDFDAVRLVFFHSPGNIVRLQMTLALYPFFYWFTTDWSQVSSALYVRGREFNATSNYPSNVFPLLLSWLGGLYNNGILFVSLAPGLTGPWLHQHIKNFMYNCTILKLNSYLFKKSIE